MSAVQVVQSTTSYFTSNISSLLSYNNTTQ